MTAKENVNDVFSQRRWQVRINRSLKYVAICVVMAAVWVAPAWADKPALALALAPADKPADKPTTTPATPAAHASTSLTLVGNGEIVWVFRAVPAGSDNAPLLQFAYSATSPKGIRFRRLPIAPSSGEIVRAAIIGNQLHVFFSDGTHYRFRPPPGSDSPDRAGRNDFPEVNLPSNQVPAALAGDSKTEMLYAVVPVEIARRLAPATEEPEAVTTEAVTTEAVATEAVTTEDVTTNAAKPPTTTIIIGGNSNKEPAAPLANASGNGLVRYAGNAWEIVCGIPAFLDDGQVCGLTAHESVVSLFWGRAVGRGSGGAGAELRYSAWSPVRSKWSSPTTVPGVLPDDVLSAVLIEGKPTLLVRVSAAEANTFNLRAVSLSDGEWHTEDKLTVDGQPLVFSGASVAAHQLGDQIAVAFTEVGAGGAAITDGTDGTGGTDDTVGTDGTNGTVGTNGTSETVRIGFWPVAGGDPTTAPAEVVALLQGQDEEEAEQLRTLAATVVLVLTMTVVVMRRRESFLVDAVLPAGFRLAHLSRRLAAVLIDSVAVTILVSPWIVVPWLRNNGIALTDDVQAEVQWLLARDPGAVFWLWIKVAIAFTVYAVAFEATVAATPGKLLFGLRVFNVKGERASFFAVLLRNVLRLEMCYPGLQFAPIGILAVLTRNRQRLGDLLARTVVLERCPKTTGNPETPGSGAPTPKA